MRKRLAIFSVILGVLFGAIGTTTVAFADHRDCPHEFDNLIGCDEGDGDDGEDNGGDSDDGSSTDDGGTRTYRPISGGGGGGRADASDANDELAFTK